MSPQCYRRAANGREPAAGGDGGDAEPAAQMAEEGVGGAEQLAAHAGRGGERAHQQKQRHDGEIQSVTVRIEVWPTILSAGPLPTM